ncbi:MAG: PH domain-containing protein [Chitinophagaceae bacterium]
MIIFTASMDRTTKLITGFITVLVAVITLAQFISSLEHFSYLSIFSNSILPVLYIITFVFRPIHYKLSGDKLIIHRLSSDVAIDRNTIKQVQQIEPERLKKSVRIFGVGGLFGYYGRYANHTLGSMTWYATRKNKTVLIITNTNEKIVLTPDEPEAFVERLKGS